MIKKCGIILLVVILIFGVAIPLKNVYAAESFFEVKEKKVAKDDVAVLNILLNKIEYDNFSIEIISDTVLEDAYIDEDIEFEKDENEIYIEVDKEKTNLNKITLEFEISEEHEARRCNNFYCKCY